MLWNTCECTGLSSTGKSKSIPPSILLLPLFLKYSDLASQLKTTSYWSLEEEEWQPLQWCSWPQSLWVLRCLAVVFWAPKVCQMIHEESRHLGQSTWWPGPEFESVEISRQPNMRITCVSIYGQVSHTFILIIHSNYLHYLLFSSCLDKLFSISSYSIYLYLHRLSHNNSLLSSLVFGHLGYKRQVW